ncbi:MAG TPA: class I SAM-dependent methyltransferase [Terracidiphilus sp.]|nr:class I SAM-dependent methyltransferase [Terracidiphilus sp.]
MMIDIDYMSEPVALSAIRVRAAALDFTMASEARTCALLKVMAASKPGGRLLELGTGTGVGTAWLLEGMDATATLTSVDTSPEFQAVAREVLGSDPRLTLVIEDGAAFLRRQSPASFDLIFADAMPGKYEALDDALALLKPGGLYIIDDLLPQPNWPEGHAEKVPVLLERLRADARLVMTPMEWASGLTIAVRKSE